MPNPARTRPAETAGAAGGLVPIAAALLGADVETVAALAGAAALVPSIVTWVVDHGGLRGLARRIWAGKA
ncbi:MAG: hypothetical protein AB7G37_01010 [Solirubrobacteraceae bacterium]